MIFSSLQFLVFFTIFFVLYLLLKNRGKIFFIFLLVASYYFYMSWSAPFILVLIFTTVMDYTFGMKIFKEENVKRKKLFVVLSVIMNLSLLAFFKYINFFIGNVNSIAHLLSDHPHLLMAVNIPLPVGISFFTFKSMSYTIDVYRGKFKAEKDFLKFATFVAFFPELVAGPIVRAEEILPQFSRPVNPTAAKFSKGLKLFVMGFFKKLFIADMISPYSDNVFAHIGIVSGYEVWVGLIAYTIQIYCDFSGYTDMAIGIAKMLDFDFPENFNMPYASKSITEFWRRWHMTLSFWLRDYLYISLGGNRRGKIRTDVNLFLTMLIGGLWHGANWTFVFWGGLHGAFLIIHKFWLQIRKKLGWQELDNNFLWNSFSLVLTLLCVMLAWAYFRAPDFATANAVLLKLTEFRFSQVYYLPQFFFLVLLVIGAHILYPYFYGANHTFRRNHVFEKIMYAWLILLLLLMAPTHTSPFVYFQF